MDAGVARESVYARSQVFEGVIHLFAIEMRGVRMRSSGS